MSSPRPRLVRVTALIACAALLCACGPDTRSAFPADTVYVMDGEPITSVEIDTYAEPLAEIGPSFTVAHRRRVVLTEVLIPRARSRMLHAAEREAALERLDARWKAVVAGSAEPSAVPVGNWSTIGMVTWLALRDCAVGEWTEVFEGPGAVAQAQLVSRDGDEVASREVFECRLIWEEYAPGFSTDPAIFGGKLEVVADDAETWRDVLPTRWLYELEGSKR
ncbi:MAG: hypothetical protein H6831_08605 [Planctomycetes bacterium]|nr:hypothetical protein [Planctomycetota bacterium]MCB9904454.1 hypothetical protein [Planctomycetota bacterium]